MDYRSASHLVESLWRVFFYFFFLSIAYSKQRFAREAALGENKRPTVLQLLTKIMTPSKQSMQRPFPHKSSSCSIHRYIQSSVPVFQAVFSFVCGELLGSIIGFAGVDSLCCMPTCIHFNGYLHYATGTLSLQGSGQIYHLQPEVFADDPCGCFDKKLAG